MARASASTSPRIRSSRARATACVLVLAATVAGALLGAGAVGAATVAGGPQQRLYPAHLPGNLVHKGSVIVAFRTPVAARGRHFARNSRGHASAAQLDAFNKTLAALHATSVRRLFTNVPAATLNAARARAQAATHAYVTDFTQIYQIRYSPSINAGEAANRLGKSSLLSSAMPDWRYKVPSDPAKLSATARQKALTAPRASTTTSPTTGGLPGNYSFRTDAQSYNDAASNNVTGAATMIARRFGKQPAQGEFVTNISLGTIDDTSTVIENGQRYLEQAGYPKIPVWLASQDCTTLPDGSQSCSAVLDPTATNSADGQGDLLEVMLDFSAMSPPPLGDPRVVNAPPAGLGELLGSAYGASFRLINPLENNSENFVAAFLGAAFLQSPAPTAITASIGSGFSVGGFSDYFFEQEAIIHDIVSTIVNGADTFVSISAGDGQNAPEVAMNPNGLTGLTQVTKDPSKITDIDDPAAWGNPDYSYGLTVEPQYVIDSGANDAGGDTLNDVYNNAPWNTKINPLVSHSQHTTETRWTGQQNFHSGNGSRVNVSAPADDVLILAQVEDADGNPVNPVATFPRLLGGTSASAPEIAGAAAVVRQAASLLGETLSARQVRQLLISTARPNVTPAFDLDHTNVGPQLDLTKAVQTLFDRAGAQPAPSFVRMTVAQRKAVLSFSDFRSSFWSDTSQDPAAHTATVDLSQGLVLPSSRTNETVGGTGDNVFAPITFAVDAAFMPAGSASYSWQLKLGSTTVNVPGSLFDARLPYLRLLPSEIFGLLGAPVTASADRVVTVTARSGSASIATAVTFKGQAGATHAHAVPPSFAPVFKAGEKVKISYDLRGVRDGAGGLVDGGVLIVSDIDRAVPQAFPDKDVNVHGFKRTLSGLVGTITLTAADFPHGVGTYGVALRATKHGAEVADSTSFFLPLRFAPGVQKLPATPKVQAAASLLNGAAPLFYDIADIEPGGSRKFAVTYDVRSVPGARHAVIEFSAPTYNFAGALFFTGDFTADNRFVNNFTNPNGDRLDSGDDFGQPGETSHVLAGGTHGTAHLRGGRVGLRIPAADCDSTYQVRVLATDNAGRVVGVASNPSLLSYGDFSRDVCLG